MKTHSKPPRATESSETELNASSLQEVSDDAYEDVSKQIDDIRKLHASGWTPVTKKKDYDLIKDVYERFLCNGNLELVQELERLYFLENVCFFRSKIC